MSGQVKSKQRVADHGEVFTNEREVKAMVDLVWEQFGDRKKIEATYLEPACGSGNFLVEILKRKLLLVKEFDRKEKSQAFFEKNLLTAVASIYGVELLPDNAQECRERLFNLVLEHYPEKYQQNSHFEKMLKNITYILSRNIICGNALDYVTNEGKTIIFTQWAWEDESIQCKYFEYTTLLYNYKDITPLYNGDTKPMEYGTPLSTHYLDLHLLEGKEPKGYNKLSSEPPKKRKKSSTPKPKPQLPPTIAGLEEL